jgi:signal recognition particle receptor subunit beta
MVSINYSAREVCCKIVYYGPGLSGKTTNLQYIHAKVPQNTRGKLISLATEADRTLYFDFLPINIGSINDFQAKFQLYTVPGQVYYNATRKLVLRGVDGVVFVADSQRDKMDENIESLANLEENLREYGYNPDEIPLVIQYNKQDLPNVMTVAELNAQLNQKGRPSFAASATVGNGVFDTLKLIIKLVFEKAKTGGTSPRQPADAGIVRQPVREPVAAAPVKTAPYPSPVAATDVPMPAAVATAPAPLPAATMTSAPSTATIIQAVPQPAPAALHRPYPGSESGQGRERTAVPVGLGAPRAVQAAHESGGIAVAAGTPAESTPEPDSSSSPQMAPSLRRRAEARKRGFFKRMFGIK